MITKYAIRQIESINGIVIINNFLKTDLRTFTLLANSKYLCIKGALNSGINDAIKSPIAIGKLNSTS